MQARRTRRLTSVLAIAHTMAAHAGLAGILLAVYQHGDAVVVAVGSRAGCCEVQVRGATATMMALVANAVVVESVRRWPAVSQKSGRVDSTASETRGPYSSSPVGGGRTQDFRCVVETWDKDQQGEGGARSECASAREEHCCAPVLERVQERPEAGNNKTFRRQVGGRGRRREQVN